MEIYSIWLRRCIVQEETFDTPDLRHVKALPMLSVVQSVTGSYQIAIEGMGCGETRPGGCFIAPSKLTQDITHRLPESGEMTARWAFLDVVLNERYPMEELFEFPLLVPPEALDGVSRLLEEMLAHQRLGEVCLMYSAGYRLLDILFRFGSWKTQPVDEAVLDALRVIHENYASALRVEDLARAAHLSPSAFYTRFKRQTAQSPGQYLLHYRLSAAALRLEHSQESIGHIARDVGFESPFYFTRQFQRMFGLPPSEYRRRLHPKRSRG